MSGKISLLYFIFNFGYLFGCIPTESPEDRPDIPGVFTTTTATTTEAISTTSTPATTTTTPTTTTTSTTTTSTTTTTTTSTTTTVLYSCPADWVLFTVPTGQTYCYYISTDKRTYADSEADCVMRFTGGHLASVHSQEENDFIFYQLIIPLMSTDSTNLYDGQTRIGAMSPPCVYMPGMYNPGPFTYSDGTNFDWSNWCPGPYYIPTIQPEPNCYNGAQCSQIITPTPFDYPTCNNKWDNIECWQTTRYVCKAPATATG